MILCVYYGTGHTNAFNSSKGNGQHVRQMDCTTCPREQIRAVAWSSLAHGVWRNEWMSDTHRSPDDHDNGVPPSRPPTGTRPVASLPVESLCNLLADARVRAILRAFEQASEATLDQSTVVEELASESPHAREDVSLQLRHIVLPKLTDVGVLDHAVERMRIQYRPQPRLTSLLVHAREDPKPVQNRLFGVLGHPQRRTILSGLVDADEHVH